MNTGIRRFILRLIIGLLTFVVGVGAAMLLGGFRPFQSFASSPSYRYRDGGYHQGLTAQPAYQYPVYNERGCKMKKKFGELPPPLPPAEAPAPPSVR